MAQHQFTEALHPNRVAAATAYQAALERKRALTSDCTKAECLSASAELSQARRALADAEGQYPTAAELERRRSIAVDRNARMDRVAA